MKKTLIALGAIALFTTAAHAASSSNVQVTFTGEVVSTPCVVTVGNGLSIGLGQINAKANEKGTTVAVPFMFSQCGQTPAMTDNKVAISIASTTYGALTDGKIPTNKENVSIGFYKDPAAQDSSKLETAGVELDVDAANFTSAADGSFTLTPLFARLEAGNVAPTAGQVSTAVNFKIDYK